MTVLFPSRVSKTFLNRLAVSSETVEYEVQAETGPSLLSSFDVDVDCEQLRCRADLSLANLSSTTPKDLTWVVSIQWKAASRPPRGSVNQKLDLLHLSYKVCTRLGAVSALGTQLGSGVHQKGRLYDVNNPAMSNSCSFTFHFALTSRKDKREFGNKFPSYSPKANATLNVTTTLPKSQARLYFLLAPLWRRNYL